MIFFGVVYLAILSFSNISKRAAEVCIGPLSGCTLAGNCKLLDVCSCIKISIDQVVFTLSIAFSPIIDHASSSSFFFSPCGVAAEVLYL